MAIRLRTRLSMFAVALISLALVACGTTSGPAEGLSPTDTTEVAADVSSPSAASVASTDWRCPLTVANQSMPPGEATSNVAYHGNGVLWTRLPSGATVQPDGALCMKLHWWGRASGSRLDIAARRLDGPVPALNTAASSGYNGGFQAMEIFFPSGGCWEVTGSVGKASLTYVVRVP